MMNTASLDLNKWN